MADTPDVSTFPNATDSETMEMPTVSDQRGSLTYVEQNGDVPFEIERMYLIYQVPNGAVRGEHAHRKLQQAVFAVNGSFTIEIDDGEQTVEYRLSDPSRGLYLPPGVWRKLSQFTSDAVCLVLASAPYEESDYIRDYDEFLHFREKIEARNA